MLGQFRLIQDDSEVTDLPPGRLESLLAFLLLNRGSAQPRQRLAYLFWPDSTEAQARTNLRYVLHQLRRAWPQADHFLQSEGAKLVWRLDAPYCLDVAEFEDAVHAAEQAIRVADAHARERLERAVALYAGDLLPSCYDDWILAERERLRQLFVGALEQLVTVLEGQADYRAAIGQAQHLLRYDPLHEASYRHLIHLHALVGDRTGALRTYATCVEVLRRELDVEPSAATRLAYEHALQAETRLQEASAPPAADRSSDAALPATPLPVPLTRFIGRERERENLKNLLRHTRLLTLTGMGGVGKTRLALEVARDLAAEHRFPDGIHWIELASLADPALVITALASSVNVKEQPHQALAETLVALLRSKQLLLILDNCEQVIQEVAHLVEYLLRACPQIHILATSRERLGMTGETVWPMPMLSLPDANVSAARAMDWPSWLDQLQRADAVRLFVERAIAVLPVFTLTAINAPAIVQICRRVEGLPLAIELAAARVRVLSPNQIADGLDDALRMLNRGSSTSALRQQTLRASLDWSHTLLSPAQQALFRRLAVFAGTFTLEAIEHVTTDDEVAAADLVSTYDVLDLLSKLIDKSLVGVAEWGQGEQSRYRLLEPVRQYAQSKLLESGEAPARRARHAQFFLSLAQVAESKFTGPEEAHWLNQLEAEHDNLRASLTWAMESGAAEIGLAFAGALWRFWLARDHYREGREWISRLLDLGNTSSPALRAKVLTGACAIAWLQGDYAVAQTWGEASVGLYRELGDRRGLAQALLALSNIVRAQGDGTIGRMLLQESFELWQTLGHERGMGAALFNLGEQARAEGNLAEATQLYQQSLPHYRLAGDRGGEALALSGLANGALIQGELEQAQLLFAQSLAIWQATLTMHQIALCLIGLAAIAVRQANAGRAARLLGAAQAIRQRTGTPLETADRALYEQTLETACVQLGESDLSVNIAEGRALSPSQTLAYALSKSDSVSLGGSPLN